MPLLCSGYLSVRFHGPVLRLKWGQRQEPIRAAISGGENGEAAGESVRAGQCDKPGMGTCA